MLSGKIPFILAGIVLFIISHAGNWYISDKNGYSRAIAEVSTKSAKLVEEARAKEVKINADNQIKVAQLVESAKTEKAKVSELYQRLKLLQRKPVNQDNDRVCSSRPDPNIIELYNSAIDSQYLPKNINISFIIGEGNTIESYQLYTIEEYNRVTNQLNTLIDVTRGLDCVVNG